MAATPSCPSCGEEEELRGENRGSDIRVSCLRCGASWMRGVPVCAGCGRDDLVERPQAMTRYSRGNQLSIIGWRQLPLCRECDAPALERSIAENVAVHGDYVSRALHAPGSTPPPPRDRRPGPPVGDEPPVPRRPEALATSPKTSVSEARTEVTAPSPESPAEPSCSSSPPRAVRGRAPSPPMAVPTVRQAIQAFLADASGSVDHTAMLLLGTHLGSQQRLNVLEGPEAAASLARWFADRWGEAGGETTERARETLCRAVDHWGVRGWLATDPAAELR
ncbi:hypothetical protein [Streptomyces sp. ST2-7A]|uniref:hypothetical protein n=1 Tax=Streptomyces sp. ST2-7A TaxID=2907214 RepID=UPI001F1E01B7|nr:hypothetical protein [Streptomyces sp. ST2-7A]MCE7081625.1 hypothetical protein [Streptomyces sp. ST2-7A]